MTFLWLWAYSLKTPLSVICGVAVLGCFLGWLSAKKQRGEQNLTTLHIGILIALLWTGIYAIPAPNYNVRTVIKEVPKPYPVVRTIKYVAQKQVLTRTITQQYTADHMFDYCMDRYVGASKSEHLDRCRDFAKTYEAPRTVVQQVKVPVPSGIQIKIQHDSYADLFKQCNDGHEINVGGADGAKLRNDRIAACTDYALKGSHDH